MLHLDVETVSPVDLKTAGSWRYFEHPETDLHCAAWAIDDGPVELWLPEDPPPRAVVAHIQAGLPVAAFNAPFEYLALKAKLGPKYGWPVPKIEQMECIMVRALAMSLPGNLESCAEALQLPVRKDDLGRRTMMVLARPRNKAGSPYWKPTDAPAKFQILYNYCKNDVVVEREIARHVRPLSPAAKRLWVADQAINARGLQIDVELVHAAIAFAKARKDELDKEMTELTRGQVTACSQAGKLLAWAKRYGYDGDSVDKEATSYVLQHRLYHPFVQRAFRLRQAAAKSSVAKYDALLARISKDRRLRGAYRFHRAGTGRWGSEGVQLHNLPRGTIKAPMAELVGEILRGDLKSCRALYGEPLDVCSTALRGTLVPAKGKVFVVADYKQIEAKVTPWTADDQKRLDVFRAGQDVYKVSAADIFGKHISYVTGQERQIGKVAELSLGFGGGKGAFVMMARNYGVEIDELRAEEIKVAWREANPKIPELWYAQHRAAMSAVRNPGRVFAAGKYLKYAAQGRWLWCQLPSGRRLCYPFPRIKDVETPWGQIKPGLTYMGVDSVRHIWCESVATPGLLTENTVQAIACDCLGDTLQRAYDDDIPVAGHTHDEAILEVAANEAKAAVAWLHAQMGTPASWAPGLPLGADIFVCDRYEKH